MKKDLFKKPLMISLALCLAASVNVFGAPGDGGDLSSVGAETIEGSSTVRNPIYSIIIPTGGSGGSYNIAIDPFEKNEIGNQLYSASMPIINKSDSAVKVTVDVAVSPKSGVTLAYKEKTAVEQDNSTATDHQIYAGLNPALDIVVKSDFGGIEKVNKNSTYEAAVHETASGKADAQLVFALDKAVYTGTYPEPTTFSALAGANKGVAAYRFVGKVNPYVAWAAGDLIPTAKYTIVGLSDANYRSMPFAPEGANLVDISNAENVLTTSLPSLIGDGGTAIPTVSLVSKTDVSFKLDFGKEVYAGDTVKSVNIDNNIIGTPIAYMYDPAAKTLKIKKEAPFYTTFASKPGRYKVIVTFNNGAKAVGHLTVTA